MPDIDRLKCRKVPGTKARYIDERRPDVEDHIAQVRGEFIGQPEINAYHAALIVRIRRGADLAKNIPAFFALWENERQFLLDSLDSRWLISALDTFADHGAESERLGAMSILGFMNMLKLANTEYMLCGSPTYCPVAVNDNIERYPVMWDNRRVFHLPDDDTFVNTIRRLRAALVEQPLFLAVFEILLRRCLENDTTLARLARMHERGLW